MLSKIKTWLLIAFGLIISIVAAYFAGKRKQEELEEPLPSIPHLPDEIIYEELREPYKETTQQERRHANLKQLELDLKDPKDPMDAINTMLDYDYNA